MKQLLAVLAAGLLLGSAYTSQAADDLFGTGEVNLLAYGNYLDKQDNHWGAGAELNYFMTRFLGLGVGSHWENVNGTFFDNVFGDVYLRYPIAGAFAPYAVGTGGYDFEGERWFGGGGVGVDLRFHRNFGLFSDVQWLVREHGGRDGIGVRAGLRVGF